MPANLQLASQLSLTSTDELTKLLRLPIERVLSLQQSARLSLAPPPKSILELLQPSSSSSSSTSSSDVLDQDDKFNIVKCSQLQMPPPPIIRDPERIPPTQGQDLSQRFSILASSGTSTSDSNQEQNQNQAPVLSEVSKPPSVKALGKRRAVDVDDQAGNGDGVDRGMRPLVIPPYNKISTGDGALDRILGGGVRVGTISEFCGER